MSGREKHNLIWTAICFAFMIALILILNSVKPLWLISVWLLGYEY